MPISEVVGKDRVANITKSREQAAQIHQGKHQNTTTDEAKNSSRPFYFNSSKQTSAVNSVSTDKTKDSNKNRVSKNAY